MRLQVMFFIEAGQRSRIEYVINRYGQVNCPKLNYSGHEYLQAASVFTRYHFLYRQSGAAMDRDAFESDGVSIVENGAYFDIGKRF
jgi:hypothetical protein